MKLRIPEKYYEITAEAVSWVMLPFVMPLYLLVLLFWGNTFFNILPGNVKLYISSVVILNTIIVPMLFTWLLKSVGLVKSYSLSTRRERYIPLLITITAYFFTMYLIAGTAGGGIINRFLLAVIICLGVAFAVTFFYKISLHMVAAGAALGVVYYINVSGIGLAVWQMIVLIIMSGVLGASRLYLGHHTITQVGLGYLAGFVLSYGTLTLF